MDKNNQVISTINVAQVENEATEKNTDKPGYHPEAPVTVEDVFKSLGKKIFFSAHSF